METTDAFAGLWCLSCETTAAPPAGRCPDCGGVLDPVYDGEALAQFHGELDDGADGVASAGTETPLAGAGLGRFAPALPFGPDRLVTLGEGGTSPVECPTLAADFGVETVWVVDEGRNPTGGLADREMALAVTAARETGASEVALPTTGNGGQAASAYAARAGLESHSFVPSRSVFANKAMINVHGGEMSVVGGRYPDAREAFADASGPWYSLAPFETPYRHEGVKTLAYDLTVELDTVPDAVVHPTGHGTGLVGLGKGFRELAGTDTIDEEPRLYAAQAAGCAPIVDAWEAGERSHDPVEYPDTICGALEVPEPAGGGLVLSALERTDGGAVSTEDDALLEGAVSLADAGVPTSATGGAAVAGARALAERGTFAGDDVVVLVNPNTANREADVLRSYLMKQGI